MQSNLTEFEREYETRPVLLNVLCILTFIGSSWTILSNSWVYVTAAKTARMVTYSSGTMPADSLKSSDSVVLQAGRKKREVFGDKLFNSISKMFTEDTIRKNALGAIISAVFTLLGAIFMWKLQRRGFYLYIVGVLIGLIVPFYLYGSNLLAVGISVFGGFFGLVFIALYVLTFKALRK